MPYTTIASGVTLLVPTRGTRSWAQTFLDEFARKISAHDHTGSPKGLAIGTNAISANAVDDTKIRLRNNQYLRARNAAGSDDIDIFRINASDELEFSDETALSGASIGAGSLPLTALEQTTTINTWTPTVLTDDETINGTIAYVKQSAFWLRVGPMIFISIGVELTADAFTGFTQINVSIPSDIPLIDGETKIPLMAMAESFPNAGVNVHPFGTVDKDLDVIHYVPSGSVMNVNGTFDFSISAMVPITA